MQQKLQVGPPREEKGRGGRAGVGEKGVGGEQLEGWGQVHKKKHAPKKNTPSSPRSGRAPE